MCSCFLIHRSIFKFEEQKDKIESDYYKFVDGDPGEPN